MVEVKVERSEIVFRVVYFGSQAATKFANLRGVYDALERRGDGLGEMSSLMAGGDRVVGFRHRPAMDPIYGMEVGFEIFTIPGEIQSGSNETLLLAAADAIVYLDDRSDDEAGPAVFQSLIDAMGDLEHEQDAIPFFVQCYRETPEDRSTFYRERRSERWQPVVRRISPSPDGALEVFDEVEKEVARVYEGYQAELKKAGLDGHVKIRDRVYERVKNPGAGVEELGSAEESSEVTELRPREDSSQPPSRRAWGSLVAVGLGLILAGLAAYFASVL